MIYVYILFGYSRKDGFISKIGISGEFPERLATIRRTTKKVKNVRLWLKLPLWWAKYYEETLHTKYSHLRRPQEGSGGTEWFKVFPLRPIFWLLYWWLLQTISVILGIALFLLPYIYIVFK